MKDLKKIFLNLKEEHPSHGDVILMWYAVNQMGYSKDIIRKVFNSCVSRDEYDQEDKPEIIDQLFKASSNPGFVKT